jgi:Holliday junction resolvase RusA-like endonuclease
MPSPAHDQHQTAPALIQLELVGRPASKKNSRVLVRRPGGRGRGILSLPSHAYERFRASALAQLRSQARPHAPLACPVRVDYTFYQQGRLRQDVDNAIASINDVLQEAAILLDDDLVVAGSFRKIPGCAEWRTEVVIRPIEQ